MGNRRRYYPAHAEYFITIVTRRRKPIFRSERAVLLFLNALAECKRETPFGLRAWVILPDHIHMLIKPKRHSRDISKIIGVTKRNFTKCWRRLPEGTGMRESPWKKQFHDHIIRNSCDLENHVNYIHRNPVKHGFAGHPGDYPYSSYWQFVMSGEYSYEG